MKILLSEQFFSWGAEAVVLELKDKGMNEARSEQCFGWVGTLFSWNCRGKM